MPSQPSPPPARPTGPPPPTDPLDWDGYEPPRRRFFVPIVAALVALAVAASGVYYFMSLVTAGDEDPSGAFSGERSCLVPERRPPSFAAPPRTLEQQIGRTRTQVEALRGLRFKEPVEARAVSRERLGDTVGKELDKYPDRRAEKDATVLALLGMLPPDTDIKAEVRSALRVQVAGLYEPEKDRLLVGTRSRDVLGPAAAAALAHELQHALADQHFGLPEADVIAPGKEDRFAALLALIEGEASLIEQLYLFSVVSPEERADLATDPTIQEAVESFGDIPFVLRETLLFPYTRGLTFVCALYNRGGWAAVDRAFEEPPDTTLEVMFPDSYPDARPHKPEPTGELRNGWRNTHHMSLGAFDLWLLFRAPGLSQDRSLDDPLESAAGWAGGALELWERGAERALAIGLEQRQGRDLCGPMSAWYFTAFPGRRMKPVAGEVLAVEGAGRAGVVACSGASVRVGIAPTLPEARTLAGTTP